MFADIAELPSGSEPSWEASSPVVARDVEKLPSEERSGIVTLIVDSPMPAVDAPEPRAPLLMPRDSLTSRNAPASALDIGRRSNDFHTLCLSL